MTTPDSLRPSVASGVSHDFGAGYSFRVDGSAIEDGVVWADEIWSRRRGEMLNALGGGMVGFVNRLVHVVVQGLGLRLDCRTSAL